MGFLHEIYILYIDKYKDLPFPEINLCHSSLIIPYGQIIHFVKNYILSMCIYMYVFLYSEI